MFRGIRNGLRFYARPMPWQNDSFLEIGSRQIFNEEHDMIREQFRKYWNSIDRERVTKPWFSQTPLIGHSLDGAF